MLQKPLLTRIPRILHQTNAQAALPPELAQHVQKLQVQNLGWRYEFYDDNACVDFIRKNYDMRIQKAYGRINPRYGAARADFFRYLLIYRVGGVYLDLKSGLSKRLDDIVSNHEYLLSHWDNLQTEGQAALQLLFKANRRLHKAYLLKESFDQLWDYWSAGWARRFFRAWRAALRWQRLAPFEKFARMVASHWDGIEAYCHAENKVSLGFVEGINNKIRAIQRRAYGFRDEEYLRLKILTCTLPKL